MKQKNYVLLFLVLAIASFTPPIITSYAQLTDENDDPLIIDAVPLSDRIEAAEANTDIDLEVIDDNVKQILDNIPRLQGIILEEPTAGSTAGNILGRELIINGLLSDIDRAFWNIRFEVGYAIPASEVELERSEEDDGPLSEDEEEELLQISEFQAPWMQAINVTRLENLPAGDSVLDVTEIDTSAKEAQGKVGTLIAQIRPFLPSQPPAPNSETTQTLLQMSNEVLDIRDETILNVPIEEAQVVGGMADSIETLRSLQAQYGG